MTAGANDLVTLADAYAWLNITPGSDDMNLQLTTSAVSQAIASWCNRNFVVGTYSEVYDGTGGNAITLRNYPIISVASLTVNGQGFSLAGSPFQPGFVASGRTIALNGGGFSCGYQNVAVTYTAGLATIPADLKLACLNWLSSWYLGRDRDPDVLSRRAGDTEEKFGRISTAMDGASMPAQTYSVLSQYRNVVPV